MASDFGRCISSPLFTFTVGADKKEITVHSSAFAGLSQTLNALINGEMIEARTRHVDWSDVDVDTFARLCEFAYFQNYTPPSFRLIDDKSPRSNMNLYNPILGPEPAYYTPPSFHSNMSLDNPLLWPEVRWTEPDLFASMPEFYHNKIRLPKNALYNDSENPSKAGTILTRQFHNTFTESLVIPSPQSDDLNPTFTPPQNTGTWEDFTPMFLEQARLYVLADKYGIERLCQLVIFKLYQTLRTFKLYDTGVSAIIEFVRFVYLNTPPNYGKVDALRNLATSYVVSVLGQIGRNECFETLLEEGGPFVSDFFHILRSVA